MPIKDGQLRAGSETGSCRWTPGLGRYWYDNTTLPISDVHFGFLGRAVFH